MNPLAIFTGPYALLAKWGVIALLAASLFGYGWVKGNQHGTEKLTEYQGQEAIATVKQMKIQTQIVHDVQLKYVDRIKEVQVKGDTIVQKVTEYVTKIDDSGCTIPAGFVREFEAAWEGTPSGPPSESDRGPSGIPLSTVAETDASNATSCLVYKAQRDGLIEFYRKLQQAE